jgi:hypothetical protein
MADGIEELAQFIMRGEFVREERGIGEGGKLRMHNRRQNDLAERSEPFIGLHWHISPCGVSHGRVP